MNNTKRATLIASLLNLHESAGSSFKIGDQLVRQTDFLIYILHHHWWQRALHHRCEQAGNIELLTVTDD